MADTECFVLDVGQGMSSVIVAPGGRVVFVDGGPTATVALEFLRRLPSRWTIEAVVVSHNDTDHARGVTGILRAHFDRVLRVYALVDREGGIAWLDELAETLDEREWTRFDEQKLKRLELDEGNTKRLWPYPGLPRMRKDDPEIVLLFPKFGENRTSAETSSSNATSGVVQLRRGQGSVLFAADAPEGTWKKIVARHGRIACDVLVYPHHGGKLSPHDEVSAEWLLSEAIACKQLVVFSVGTRNGEGHPSDGAVAAAGRLGGRAVCTQITSRCCAAVESMAPGLRARLVYEDRASRCGMGAGRSPGVGCFGTVRVVLDGKKAAIDDVLRHEQAVDGCATKGWEPMCRRPRDPKPVAKPRSRR